MAHYSIETEEGGRLELELAGAGSRAAAGMLDLVFCAIALFGFFMLIELLSMIDPTFFSEMAGAAVVGAGLMVPGIWALFFAVNKADTPGKGRLGLMVLDQKGGPPSLGQLLIRALILPADIWTIGLISIFVHPEARRMGDMAAGTVVVRLGGRPDETRKRSKRGVRQRARKRRRFDTELVDEYGALMTPARLARLSVSDQAMHADLYRRQGLREGVRADLEGRLATHFAKRFDLAKPEVPRAFLDAVGEAL